MGIGFTAEGGVEAVRREQTLMGPPFNNPAPFHDQNLVRMADGGETVGDHEAGATLQQVGERLLDQPLGRVVDAGRRLVEDEDRGIRE